MTTSEMAALEGERPGVGRFTATEPGFWSLAAGPCPFYDHGCTVYDVRPYNCRRWGCFVGPEEPVTDFSAVPLHILRDPDLIRQYATQQTDAQAWAIAHGWTDEA